MHSPDGSELPPAPPGRPTRVGPLAWLNADSGRDSGHRSGGGLFPVGGRRGRTAGSAQPTPPSSAASTSPRPRRPDAGHLAGARRSRRSSPGSRQARPPIRAAITRRSRRPDHSARRRHRVHRTLRSARRPRPGASPTRSTARARWRAWWSWTPPPPLPRQPRACGRRAGSTIPGRACRSGHFTEIRARSPRASARRWPKASHWRSATIDAAPTRQACSVRTTRIGRRSGSAPMPSCRSAVCSPCPRRRRPGGVQLLSAGSRRVGLREFVFGVVIKPCASERLSPGLTRSGAPCPWLSGVDLRHAERPDDHHDRDHGLRPVHRRRRHHRDIAEHRVEREHQRPHQGQDLVGAPERRLLPLLARRGLRSVLRGERLERQRGQAINPSTPLDSVVA